MVIFLFFQTFTTLELVAFSSTRGEVWLLLVSPPLLRSGSDASHSLSPTASNISSITYYFMLICCCGNEFTVPVSSNGFPFSLLFRLSSVKWHHYIVTCQPFVGSRNGALLGSRLVNKSSAQPRWRHTSGVRECQVCLHDCQETSRHLVRLQREWGT
jgi:hypothetical protein